MVKDYEAHGDEVPAELYQQLDESDKESQELVSELTDIFTSLGELNDLDEKKSQEHIQTIKKTVIHFELWITS